MIRALYERFREYYRWQKIAGKLNVLLLFLLAVILVNGLLVMFSLYLIKARNEVLWDLERFEKQVDYVEQAQLRFRISHGRNDALSAREALGRAREILGRLPAELIGNAGQGDAFNMDALMNILETRFGEYLFYYDQSAALESGMHKALQDLTASMQAIQADKTSGPASAVQAVLVQSILRTRIVHQQFVLSRDMDLSAQMDEHIQSIVAASALMRARAPDVETQITAYNIGQEAMLLNTAFLKLSDYTRKTMVSEESMARAGEAISERVDAAARQQRESIAKEINLIVFSMFVASLLVIVFGFVLGRRFVRGITQPLIQLVEVSESVARGNYAQQIVVQSQDEISALALSFNRMAGTVKQQIDTLSESEQRVRQRTSELESANRALVLAKESAEALNASLESKVQERTAALREANRRLTELTVTDALTGLSNRRHFDAALSEEWSRAARNGQTLAVFMFDVDFFKAYNDHYGHQAGDECLRNVARILKASARRAGDLVARYGGEEFVAIAVGVDLETAVDLAESMRQAVERLSMPHAVSPIGREVTISIGVAVAVPAVDSPAENLLRRADQALYRAKEAGRNCVVS